MEGNLFAGSTAVFNSWVGIGTSTPTSELHVVGAGLFSGNLGVGSSLTVDGPAVLNGNIGLGSSANDAVTFNGRLATSTAILPINDLGADLGSASLRFNNIYVANINTSVAQSYVGQVTFTYEPADTTYTEGSVLINPTNPPANSTLLGVGIAGYERARIDAEGDIILGYNEEISAPVTSYPLTIYNHDFTMVAYVDTSGNANFNGMINVGVGLTTPKLTMTNGAQNNYILRSDAAGNATWVEPHSSGIGETYNSNNGITLDPDTRYFQLGGALIQDTRLNIGNTEVFFIDYPTGYVGIGTTAPAYQLDLVGNSANYLASINNGNTGASSAGLYVRVDGTGNILNLNYAGSDIFTVTQAQSTFNNTVNFTASGDVSIANDLNFTNTTASYIKSDSSLVLESGEIFNSSDFTLRTFNTGNIILESANLWADGTNVGIGTTNPFGKFMVGIGNTQAFIVSSGGNVGLGTTNPIALLETDGTSWLRGSTTQQGLYVNSSGLVGVGITNPLYGLHINGTGLVSTFFGVGATNPNYSLYTNAKLGVASTAYFASYVGIGTTDPRAKLDIVGSESEFVALKLTNAGEVANQLVSLKFINGDPDWNTDTGAIKSKYYTGGTDGDLSFWTRESGTTYQRMVINNLGSVGIGTTDPTYKLDVTGNTNVGGTATVTTLAIGATNPITPLAIANLTTTAGTTLVVDADGNVYKTSSSRRFKENIADYSDDFAKILQIQPKSFNYKATGAPDIGYIAEDLDELGLSSLVIYDKLGQPSAIKYDRISLYLLEILKKQEEKIVALSAEINESTPNVDILLQDATSSAYLKGIRVENDIQLTENIILDGNLNVLGQATFGEIGVTGKITNGSLVINGLDESGSASISTLSGPLELQKNSLGNIEMMDGRVIVDTKGNITISGEVTAKKYNVDETDTASASVGEGIILADNLETLIETTAASESSRIFVSPKEAAVPLGVSEQNKGSFKVILEKKLSKDLKFSWWVIN